MLNRKWLFPPSVKREFFNWCKSVQKKRIIKLNGTKKKKAEVFVDASLQGWGGVIVWESGELEILGGAWPYGGSRHINILEADALARTLGGISHADHLDIWVDNTSVCGAFRKRMCVRSHDLNFFVIKAVERILFFKCSFSLKWVSTKYNPADIPSREAISSATRQKVELALGEFFNSRRGGGAGNPTNRTGTGSGVQPIHGGPTTTPTR